MQRQHQCRWPAGGGQQGGQRFGRLFKQARARGELSPAADPAKLAQLATAAIHTMAVRARLRTPRKELEAIAEATIDLICGR